MAILKIARMGHPILAERAKEIPDPTAREVRKLVEDMYETLDDIRGAGLAAPQVHISKRLVIFEAPQERGEEEEAPETDFAPMTEIINPEWQPLSDEMALGWEGCLSVPGLTGAVERHTHIRYRGYSPQGQLIDREATGFHARVFQHEFDHLDGILYPMRMQDLSLLVFTEEAQKFGLPSLGANEESEEPSSDGEGEAA
ncbi:MAG: peptide deformylase [Alphaproteobacteria bacterium]|nr:peptide deformylase [Alphaproteobacteria bacterium]